MTMFKLLLEIDSLRQELFQLQRDLLEIGFDDANLETCDIGYKVICKYQDEELNIFVDKKQTSSYGLERMWSLHSRRGEEEFFHDPRLIPEHAIETARHLAKNTTSISGYAK